MRFIQNSIIACVITCFSPLVPLMADEATPPPAGKGSFSLSLVAQDLNWKEDLNDGTFLEESGILLGLSLDGSSSLASQLALHYRAQIYGGTVDYDGFIINLNGGKQPYKSDTTYYGLVGDLDASMNLSNNEQMQLRPFAGIGTRYWLRKLDDGGRFGYDEYWLTVYGRAGLRVHVISSPATAWHLMAAVILPFYNYEWAVNVPFTPDDSIELEPKEKTGYQVEGGVTHGRLAVAVFYEALDFGQSNPDKTGVFYQPASEMRLIGVRAGITF